MRGKRQGAYSPRRGGGQGSDDSNRWLGTYGDAITLLMAFFVMLYAMSEVDVAKFEAFVRGLQDPFGNPAASQGLLDSAPAIVGDAGDDVPGDDTEPFEVPSPVEERPPTDDIAQLETVEEAILASLSAAGLEDLADFRFDGRGLVLSLATDNVLFASGSTEISELGRSLIAAIAEPLAAFDNDVFVEGHTDDVPLSRGGYTNWNLSTDRAVAVVNLLARAHGLDEARLGAAGYADNRPRVPNDGPDHRAMNRRVDVLIVAEGVS
jgi:chemotaxis protein MotB